MVLEITNSERDLLFELIESAHREMIQEIDHTDTRDFRKLLQNKVRPPDLGGLFLVVDEIKMSRKIVA